MSDIIHEECGVFGISSLDGEDVALQTYYGIFALQHRGQESCGIAVNDRGVITRYKDVGIVNDVFTHDIVKSLGKGQMAVGHVRYGTKITATRSNSQPMTVNHRKGSMALALNGSITNACQLRRELELSGSIFHSVSDSELIASIIVKERLKANSIEAAISEAMKVLKGAYSMVVMSPGKLIGVRDPNGFRPLVLGKKDSTYVLASETCALDAVGVSFVRDIAPGEIIIIDANGVRGIDTHIRPSNIKLCSFEYIYFSRPDSVVDGVSVHEARKKAGTLLALSSPVDADVVIGIPDSGIDAAMGYSMQAQIPYGLGFIKNKYIGRTFIENTQAEREDRVKIKLNVVESTVKNKRVVMVDDSIVRGTTCRRIVRLLRNAGATQIHVRSSAPPFLNPCYFGTDIDSKEDLIACKYSVEETAAYLGADSLAYLSLSDLPRIADNPKLSMCDACFSGNYPIDISDALTGEIPSAIRKIEKR